jgi:hypothetical protein
VLEPLLVVLAAREAQGLLLISLVVPGVRLARVKGLLEVVVQGGRAELVQMVCKEPQQVAQEERAAAGVEELAVRALVEPGVMELNGQLMALVAGEVVITTQTAM